MIVKKIECEGYVSAGNIHQLEFKYILVATTDYYEEIKNDLVSNYGIPEDKVISMNELLIKTYQLELGGYRKQTSITDDQIYPAFCLKAAEENTIFSTFRMNPIIKRVYEHVTQIQGQKYLDFIRQSGNFGKVDWRNFIQNDQYGSPEVFDYNIGEGEIQISPVTLRYVKVLCDIIEMYNTDGIKSIAEIGIGYGGECRIISSYLKNRTYILIDLPEVLKLAQTYLEKFDITGDIRYVDGTKNIISEEYDLVISNYAFSELTRDVQEIYLEKVITHSKAGYITWNSLSYNSFGGYSVKELVTKIKGAFVIEEKPLTAKDNCIVVWGMEE